MIDVYRVDREVSRVHAVDLEDVTTLAGGPEDVLTALESGALDPESPVVIAGEEHWPTVSPDVVADGYRKRERSFGRLEDALSEVMARDEPYRLVRGAHDYPGVLRRSASSPGTTASPPSPRRRRAGTPTPWARCGPRSVRTPRSTGCPRPTGSPPVDRSRGAVGRGSLRRAQRARPGLGPGRRRRVHRGAGRGVEVDAGDQVSAATSTQPPGSSRWAWTGDRSIGAGHRDRRGRDKGCRRAARDLHSRCGRRPGSSSPARHRRDTTFVLRARPPRRGCIDAGLGVGCGYVADARVGEEESGMVRDLTVTEDGRGTSRERWSPARPRRRSGCSSRSWRAPGYRVLDLPGGAQPGRPARLRR